MKISLRRAEPADLRTIWEAAYSDLAWKQFDAPYFPFEPPTLESFEAGFFQSLCEGRSAQLIEIDGRIGGQVSAYWEYEPTRWLEAGILIYSSKSWGSGVGQAALKLWVTHLFETFEVERIGLTTWSGNPRMIRCAERVGFTLEGRLRKCRYYAGTYYDSIRLGVLREEWARLLAE
jgi:RimJ/RimL family protein N-acetyltransferase